METRHFQVDSIDDLKTELAEKSTDTFKPTLAIVFASIQHRVEEIQTLFKTANITLFGATSSGELLDIGEDDNVFDESIVVMLFDAKSDYFKLKTFDGCKQKSYELGQSVGNWVKADTFAKPAVLLMTSGMMTDGEQVVQGLTAQTSPTLPVFGGMAGDDNQFKDTFVFDGEKKLSQSAIALVFDTTKIEVQGVASSGWQAVAGEKTITNSEGNVVRSIDDKPATEVYREYLGFSEESKPELAPQYPLQIMRDEGYSVMRAALMVDFASQSIVYAGSVPEGSQVKFCVSPGIEITTHTLAELETFKNDHATEADALVLFSCKGRHLALGPMAEDEVRPIQQLWDVPLIGFYTYGEIGNKAGYKLDFHNETCVLVTLKEKLADE